MPQGHPEIETFEVVIVGAGVAGGLIANVLASNGVKVLILEAGEQLEDRSALVNRWAAAAYKGLGTPYAASHPEMVPGPEQVQANGDPRKTRDDYYDQAGPENYPSTYERRVGGSTLHWLGHTPRLLPNDFRMKSEYGVGIDWPIHYNDIESWYCEAETALGVAGDGADWDGVYGAFRSKPFPMPPIWPSWSDLIYARALSEVEIEGHKLVVRSTPSARNSQPYDDRPPCAGNASCIPICPIGAKYDASVHIGKARSAGAVLRDKCIVLSIGPDATGRMRNVTYSDWDNTRTVVSGRLIVVAANAIESAKLLLLSNERRAIANSSDQVGRNLMDHVQKTLLGTAPQPLYPYRGPPVTSGIETFRDGDFRTRHAAFRISLGNDGWSRGGSPYTNVAQLVQTQKIFGAELRQRLFDDVSRQGRLSCSVEVLPNPDNRVTLSDKPDKTGVPRPRLSFATDNYSRSSLAKAQDVMSAIYRAIGATHPGIDRNPLSYTGAGHIMGTCRMGDDPLTSVVDADCRAHDHPELFVVGASVFPTCGTANPTMTVAALSLRAADRILQVLPQMAQSA